MTWSLDIVFCSRVLLMDRHEMPLVSKGLNVSATDLRKFIFTRSCFLPYTYFYFFKAFKGVHS